MMYYNNKSNKFYTLGTIETFGLPNGDIFIGTPTTEQLLEWGYEEYVEPMIETVPQVPDYDELVSSKIRRMYGIDLEFAILRLRDTKPEEFEQYNNYCEKCKRDAREEIAEIERMIEEMYPTIEDEEELINE